MSRSRDNLPTLAEDPDDWQRPDPCPMGELLNEIDAILGPIGFEIRMIGERTALFIRHDAFIRVSLGAPEPLPASVSLDLNDLMGSVAESSYVAVGATLDGFGASCFSGLEDRRAS